MTMLARSGWRRPGSKPGWHRGGRLLCLVVASACSAAGWADDAGFAAFAERFTAAIEAGDADAVASLTRLPFLFEGRALARDEFTRAFPRLFDAEVRSCLARGSFRPEEAGLRVAFCPPYAFYFGLSGGEWRLVEFAADGEPD
jgi:hypothetical protein